MSLIIYKLKDSFHTLSDDTIIELLKRAYEDVINHINAIIFIHEKLKKDKLNILIKAYQNISIQKIHYGLYYSCNMYENFYFHLFDLLIDNNVIQNKKIIKIKKDKILKYSNYVKKNYDECYKYDSIYEEKNNAVIYVYTKRRDFNMVYFEQGPPSTILLDYQKEYENNINKYKKYNKNSLSHIIFNEKPLIIMTENDNYIYDCLIENFKLSFENEYYKYECSIENIDKPGCFSFLSRMKNNVINFFNDSYEKFK